MGLGQQAEFPCACERLCATMHAEFAENLADIPFGCARRDGELGCDRLVGLACGNKVKDGQLADLLLVDGDPVADLGVLLDKSRLLAIMKDGEFHKTPDVRTGRSRWSLSAA